MCDCGVIAVSNTTFFYGNTPFTSPSRAVQVQFVKTNGTTTATLSSGANYTSAISQTLSGQGNRTYTLTAYVTALNALQIRAPLVWGPYVQGITAVTVAYSIILPGVGSVGAYQFPHPPPCSTAITKNCTSVLTPCQRTSHTAHTYNGPFTVTRVCPL